LSCENFNDPSFVMKILMFDWIIHVSGKEKGRIQFVEFRKTNLNK
jgi:hypothetical protein